MATRIMSNESIEYSPLDSWLHSIIYYTLQVKSRMYSGLGTLYHATLLQRSAFTP